ncbi:uncharacterized protein I303_106205 [Kwoniella dejecticola CBS 10117]|uniref:Transcription factor BYE1 n=1 Tax=Kwoniella dejecticola CBS 10117 TaxID=1296121 RepID=A0A1A6A1K0_9TREE|nr:uncharacterized protein I303_06224 [Kwoniella dejecticola CBS 10117]OBR83937.1 hypothetical protein I303_06224 [Kwoniella dejecticola CBS 10117]
MSEETASHPEASTSTIPSDSPLGTRTTGRTRVKSQRVLEAEDTKRFLSNQSKAAAEADVKVPAKAKTYGKKSKGKGKKKSDDEVYCICKTNNEGSMIECGECNDWFHFTCIGLTEDEAEKIHVYVCPECTESTDKKTTHKYDLSTFPSPSPPPGVVDAPKTKAKPRKAAPSRPSASGSDDDSGSEAQIASSSSSRQSSVHPTPPPNKRSRLSTDIKRKSSIIVERKASIDRKSSVASGALPPMRKYVRERLAPLFQGLFGTMSEGEAVNFSQAVEEGIYSNFKEIIGGKESTGTRYKTQFNLLSSSIAKGLRPDLIASITSRKLGPTQIATLTSADLASEEQLKAIEQARQSVLEQTVKSKEDTSSTIRLGRDGFEKVENVHEKEMKLLAQQEESARLRAEEERRLRENPPPTPIEEKDVQKSPIVNKFTEGPKRSESIDVSSPLKQPLVSSAWTAPASTDESEQEVNNFDQTNLDLSDIVQVGDEMELDDLDDREEVPKSDMQLFEAKEVFWSGGIVNPANPSAYIPPISLRLICKATPPDWKILLPREKIEITGRVPTKGSLQYLSDSRLNPSKELITVAFSLDEKATDEEILAWEEMVEYHIGKDRHALYLPYEKHPHPPPGSAKELYMIPLRPSDPAPEFTELIDGFALPIKGRSTSVFLGVFVFNKSSTPIPAPAPRPSTSEPPHPPQPAAIPPLAQIPAISQPVIQNDQLQALMASLNPTAIQGLVGGITPVPLGGSTPPIGGITPTPQPTYPSYTPAQQVYTPYDNSGGYTPQPQPYGGGGGSGGGYQDGWRGEMRRDERRDLGGRDPRRRDRGDWVERRESDNGWGNRGGGRGRGGGGGSHGRY